MTESGWTPEQALRFYAEGRHFDIVDGRTRILDTGAVASDALKTLSEGYAALKGVSSTEAVASSDTPRMDATLGKGADWIFAEGCKLERELAGLGRDYERLLKESTDELKAARSSTRAPSTKEHIQTDRCGFDRNSSHAEGTYVCECGWSDVEMNEAKKANYWFDLYLEAEGERRRLARSASGLSIDAVLSAIDSEPELPGEPPQEMVDAIVQAVRDTDTALLAETLRIAVRLTKQGIRERIVAATSTQS